MDRADSAAAAAGALAVTVVCCLPGRQREFALTLPAGATAYDAVLASGLLAAEPMLTAATLDLGVFGERCAASTRLRSGDRIEVYQPLRIDPKEARRLRAAQRVRSR